MYPNKKAIRDFRNTKARINVAKTLCNKCKFEWNKPVAINYLCLVEEVFNININVIELQNIPILGGNVNLFNCLLYRSENRKTATHYLLFDNEKGHFHSITNIKAFLAVRSFCNTCLKGFCKLSTSETHTCDTTIVKKKVVDKKTEFKMIKEMSHYLKRGFTKGSTEEINETKEKYRKQITNPRYIIYDFETDTHTNIHKPNHVEVDVLQIDEK